MTGPILALALVIGAPAAGAPQAGPPTGYNLADALWVASLIQRYYNSTRDFKAKFKQTYHKAYHGPQKPRFGYLWVKKPGLMRWDYVSPRKKKIVSDGRKIWIYVPEDKQAFWRPLKESALPSAVRFLWGKGRLLEDFWLQVVGESKYARAGTAVIKLVPKTPNASFKHVLFVVNTKTGVVSETVIYDHVGNKNHYVFSEPRPNTGVPSSTFQFKPPQGTRVIRADKDFKP